MNARDAKARRAAAIDTPTDLGSNATKDISGALNIGGTPILSIWAGWMLDPEKPILLVMENDDDLERIVRLFVRNVAGPEAVSRASGVPGSSSTAFNSASDGRLRAPPSMVVMFLLG
jgi:hypothetical protein